MGDVGQAEHEKPVVELGRIEATQGALWALRVSGQSASELLRRHQSGDWGDASGEDAWANGVLGQAGGRTVLSAYTTGRGERILVVTEPGPLTTMLLAREHAGDAAAPGRAG